MINTINNADSIVEVYFSIGHKAYKVRRGIKPNIFEIYQDFFELINQNASGVDYQKYLEQNILKLNYVILSSCYIRFFFIWFAIYEDESKL